MYFDIVRQGIYNHNQFILLCIIMLAPARLIMCDMLQRSVEHIISSNSLLQFLQWARILQYVIWRRQQSYSVEMQVSFTTIILVPTRSTLPQQTSSIVHYISQQTGAVEQFEQVVFLGWPMRLFLWSYHVLSRIKALFGWKHPTTSRTF